MDVAEVTQIVAHSHHYLGMENKILDIILITLLHIKTKVESFETNLIMSSRRQMAP